MIITERAAAVLRQIDAYVAIWNGATTTEARSLRCLKTAIEGLLWLDNNCRGWKEDNGCSGAAMQFVHHELTTLCETWEASR